MELLKNTPLQFLLAPEDEILHAMATHALMCSTNGTPNMNLQAKPIVTIVLATYNNITLTGS